MQTGFGPLQQETSSYCRLISPRHSLGTSNHQAARFASFYPSVHRTNTSSRCPIDIHFSQQHSEEVRETTNVIQSSTSLQIDLVYCTCVSAQKAKSSQFIDRFGPRTKQPLRSASHYHGSVFLVLNPRRN